MFQCAAKEDGFLFSFADISQTSSVMKGGSMTTSPKVPSSSAGRSTGALKSYLAGMLRIRSQVCESFVRKHL